MFVFLLLQKKNQKKESLHEAIASHHSLPQLHACSPFQFERTSVASLIIASVQWFDLINDFSLGEPFKNLQSTIFNLQSFKSSLYLYLNELINDSFFP